MNTTIDDSFVLPNISLKKEFLSIEALNMRTNIPNIVCILHKLKDEIKFSL